MKRNNQRKRHLLELVLNRMQLKFGVVENYYFDKGLGYIKNPFDKVNSDKVFFNISTIKKTDMNMFEKLHQNKQEELITLWYAQTETAKGIEAETIINNEELKFLLENKIVASLLKNKYEPLLISTWNNSELNEPVWLDELSSVFIEKTELDLLRNKRLEKVREKNEIAESKRIEIKKREMIRLARLKISEEFESLVEEVKSNGFTTSAQVSQFIIRNRLGQKYNHISGVLTMENDGSTWNFNGGFPPNIYAELCSRLNLSSNGSNSRVVDFKSFKDLE